jgi:diguanylate cyclase (GGDEF)-like protein
VTRRILVVDDEADLRLLTSFALEDAGWEVATAASGSEALAILGVSRFDLVLLDSMMPGMDGAETCRRLRADRLFDAIPVIFLSAAARQMSAEKLEELGAAGAIGKPFDVDTLAAEIDAILARGAQPTTTTAPTPSSAVPLGRVQEAWDAVRSGVAESSGRIAELVRNLESSAEELRRLSHSLAGKAPMVELTGVGTAAAQLESALSGERWSAVRVSADALVRAIQTAGRDAVKAPEITAEKKGLTGPDRGGSLIAVDDDEDLLLLIKGAFEHVGWEVRTATNEVSVLALLEEKIPDGITLDVDMPEMNGFDLCAKLRQRPELRDVPVLFLTSRSHPEDVARGLLLGSDDYLVKPIALPELVTRVTSRVGRARLLLREAHTDVLTTLPNRRAIEETLSTLALEHRRSQQEMAVAIIDLDHFKRVNDAHGHAAGDTVLKSVAGRLAAGMRRSDHCGRWGGEEFLLLFPFTTQSGALQIIERLRRELAAAPIDVAPDARPTITFSAGIAAGVPEDDSAATLIASADAACYEAKRRGRNQVVAAPALQQAT